MLFQMQFPPEKFIETLKLMEHRYGGKEFVTSKDTSLLSPGTFYLTEVDSMYRRFYAKKARESSLAPAVNGVIPAVNGVIANGHWCLAYMQRAINGSKLSYRIEG